MRILRVQIAYGMHAEARADGRHLRHLDGGDETLAICHAWAGDRESARRFGEESGCEVRAIDTGWRPNDGVARSRISKLSSLARLAWAFPRMAWTARRWRPDLVSSTQQRWDCTIGTLLSWTLRKPQVIHVHYTTPWVGAWVRWRLRRAAHVVTVSDFIRDQILELGVDPERVTTIRNSIDPMPPLDASEAPSVRDEFGIPADAPLLGIIGRLVPWKGQPDTIAALARLGDEYVDAHLLVAGDGPAREELEQQAETLGIAERVHFAGFRDDVPRLLDALDVFVHPSRDDPCPLSLLEGLAAAKPVVAYAEGGALELVDDGRTGLLAAPGDVDDLARAMRRLLASPEERDRLARAARESIELDFTPQSRGHALSGLLAQVGAAS